MWRDEKPSVKRHFKALADDEDRQHKIAFPGYRYETGRNRSERRSRPYPKLTSSNTQGIAMGLIEEGFPLTAIGMLAIEQAPTQDDGVGQSV